jgi:membrane protease YdiL (CAAX protease family)
MNNQAQGRLDLRGIAYFLLIAYGLAYLLDLPMFLDGLGFKSPWAALLPLRNFTPAIATLLVVKVLLPLPHAGLATGLRRGVKGTRWGWVWLFGWLAFIGLQLVAPFFGALLGQFPMDLTNFSGYRAFLEKAPGGQGLLAQMPLQTLAPIILLTLPLQALLIVPFTFGEEWGWRGYLLPQLLPLGQWRALIVSGVIWTFWHAPLFALGFEYPLHRDLLGVLVPVIPFTLLGILLGWTRLATGSVWPAVLGHAGIDAQQLFAALLIFTKAGVTYDTMQVFLSGWTGWIPIVLVIAVLMALRLLPVRNLPDLVAHQAHDGDATEEMRGPAAEVPVEHQPAAHRGRFSAGYRR